MTAESLLCDHCGHKCSSSSGLTLHRKTCKKVKANSVIHDQQSNGHQHEAGQWGSHQHDHQPKTRHAETNGFTQNAPRQALDLGAFFMATDHIFTLLHIDLAIALGRHILQHGSDNRAVMAFGHKCLTLDDES